MDLSLKILLVEDDIDTRINLRDILELDEHIVDAVGTAAEAQSKILIGDIDVIILDRKLPDGMSDVLLPHFRTLAPRTDLIIVTGYADMASTIAALRQGAVDYVVKPVNPDALRISLNRIAERRGLERRLHKEHELASQVFATAEAVIVVLDMNGTVIRFNPYLTKLTGWTVEETLGKDWFELFCLPADRIPIREVFLRTALGIETRDIVNAIVSKNGEVKQVRWANTTLKDEHGAPIAVLGVGLDVSEVAEAQNRALQSERLAAIGQTMTALAHESRNSLQRIQASAEILELELDGQSQALGDVRSIQRAAKDLHALLEEIRTFAAPIHLDLELCDLPDIWRHSWEYLHDSTQNNNAVILERIDDSVRIQKLDRFRMEQVFRNLFENSLAACSDSATIGVTCRRLPNEDGLEILVEDNGPGLSQEQRRRLFDPFYTTKPTGTGLGMAIVRRIVEAHHGTIRAEEHAPAGARLVITLPRSHPPLAAGGNDHCG